MKKIVYLPSARQDLQDIVSFIKSDNPGAAIDVARKIETEISRLKTFHFLGKPCKIVEPAIQDMRSLFVRPVLIFYKIEESEIVVHRILRAENDWTSQLHEYQSN